MLTPGNVNDATAFGQVLDGIRVPRVGTGRPRRTPTRVLGDKAYSSRAIRRLLWRRGIAVMIPERLDRAANRRRDGRKSCSWHDYRDLLIAAHQQLGGPIVLVWDNLNVHKAAGLREFAASRDWLTIYYLPPYAPDLNPVEGIWSLLRRGWLSNVAFSTPEHLVQRIRRGLRHIQYRSDLIDGCLAETGLTIRPR